MTDPSPGAGRRTTRSTAKAPPPVPERTSTCRLQGPVDGHRPSSCWWKSVTAKAGQGPTCNLGSWPRRPYNFGQHFDCSDPGHRRRQGKLLDDAGYKDTKGADGVRATKDGVPSVDPVPNLDQRRASGLPSADQGQWWSEIGVETELRNINASVFFGGDPGSPDTFQKFYADVEMYANNFDGTDPESHICRSTRSVRQGA